MPISLQSLSSFYVGGQSQRVSGLPVPLRRLAQHGAPRPVDPNGDHMVGQMYVQAYRLAQPRQPLPIVLWHGGGMTGVNWETTPDGRPGWLWRLLEQGYDVYVCDAPERGRSSWAMYPEIYQDAPIFRTRDEAWDMFRLGAAGSYNTDPSLREAHPQQQFPVDSFDTFAKQWVPRWAGHEAMTNAAGSALLERIGPCILIGHSQGGGFALAAAQRHPELVRALIALEPSGCPSDATFAQPLAPHLVLWGDYIAEHPVWSQYRSTVDHYLTRLQASGTPTCTLDLPAQGIAGNSHFLMMDRNSDALLSHTLAWLQQTLPATTPGAR